jgi:predicted ATPase
MENNIFETLDKIPEKEFYPYISHIRFPYYKKLKQGLRIDFPYPITAIIGINGSSKSSILRAIYGSPGWNSIGSYWFESSMDKYNDREETSKRPKSAFIYGYHNSEANMDVEVRKARVEKDGDPDYWEPTRPVGDMNSMPKMQNDIELKGRSKTRWNTISKNVIYLDFRHEAISAFDKYFYNGNEEIKEKKKFIRNRSKYIKEIIDNKKTSYFWHKKNRLKSNKALDRNAINEISKILGKKYSSIQVVEHSFYTKFTEKTIFVSSNKMEYSEAFAGSGEFAVISLVKSVMEAPEKSLIILDEPESSIHPAAQKNMLLFLAEQIKQKKHQIVFATHSPTLIENLPSKAINVLYELDDGTVDIQNKVFPEKAFQCVGASFSKKTIIVEDELAKCIIEKLLKDYEIGEMIDVRVSPGGASEIITISIINNAIFQDANNVLYILDGDQKKEHKNPKDIPESGNLDDIIKEQTGVDIAIPHSSNNEQLKAENQRKYLDFYYKYVKYLPTETPENLIWNYMTEEDKQNINDINIKECFVKLSEKIFGKVNSDYILRTQEIFLNKINFKNKEDFKELYEAIKSIF